MKKIMILAALAVFAVSGVMAQNKFKGSIIYSVTSTGEVPYTVPADYSTAEIKVFEDKVLTSSVLFTGSPLVNNVLIDGHKQYTCWDLSMIMMYLQQNDVELDYSGSNKLLLKVEYTQAQIDSLTIPCTEGYYIEYVNETKTIAGKTAKKAVIHSFKDDGEDNPITMWYSDEMGPDVNFLFNGLRGVALEYAMPVGEGQQLTLTATDIKSGKVKSVDMLLPSGYDNISVEDFGALMNEIGEEMKYLQEE
ncbi:MAG: hypothetical protein K5864_04955 [Bacteroidales bacterium]|nr:hypothetical protein [Bacteroidales bacterium]